MNKRNVFLLICLFICASALFAYYLSKSEDVAKNNTRERANELYVKAFNKLANQFGGKNRYTVCSHISDNYVNVPKSQHFKNTNVRGWLIDQEDKKVIERDVYKIFQPKTDNSYLQDVIKKHGWVISIMSLRRAIGYIGGDFDNLGGVILYQFRPFEVCFMKQDNSYYYDYMDVSEALNIAMNFYSKNDKSDFKKYGKFLKEDEYYDFVNKIRGETLNDGFYVSSFSDSVVINPIMCHYEDAKKELYSWSPFAYHGYMYNDFYRVYLEGSVYANVLPITENTEYFDEYESNEKKEYITKISFIYGISCLLIITLAILLYKYREKGLYEQLCEKCNPNKFMNPYDEEKLKEASLLYKQILQVDKKDMDKLKEISIVAEESLGVSFVNKHKIKELKAKVNPTKFIKSNNLDLVPEVTKIFNQLRSQSITSKQLFEIEKEIDNLFKKNEKV